MESIPQRLAQLSDTLGIGDTTIILDVDTVYEFAAYNLQLDRRFLTLLIARTQMRDQLLVALAVDNCVEVWGFRWGFHGTLADSRAVRQWNRVVANLGAASIAEDQQAAAVALLFTMFAVGQPLSYKEQLWTKRLSTYTTWNTSPFLVDGLVVREHDGTWEVTGRLLIGSNLVFASVFERTGALESFFIRPE